MEKIIVIDFNSQYTLLIAKIFRKLGVYTEILAPNQSTLKLLDQATAVVFSGGPHTVKGEDLRWYSQFTKLELNVPVLGICYGAQLIAVGHGALVQHKSGEYGKTELWFTNAEQLYTDIDVHSVWWMSHSYTIIIPKSNSKKIEIQARTAENGGIAAFKITDEPVYGIQFHPEVTHSDSGGTLLSNFANIAGCGRDWRGSNFVESSIKELNTRIPSNEKVLVACSGGVDSTVTALLIQKAIGDRMIGVFVDTGLMRKDEYKQVMCGYNELHLNVHGLEVADRFYDALEGIIDPEIKRKKIANLFIEIFQEFGKEHGVTWLGQGTIYPDVIETQGNIKSHHNVCDLPENSGLRLVEPLRMLFKDDVRKVGEELGLPDVFINRHPFPGPGMAIRILGEVTRKKVQMLQEADSIFINALKDKGYYDDVWQAGVILTDSKSVGVMGDSRTFEYVAALRAVDSVNGMTADVSDLPTKFWTSVATEIVNKVSGINRVVHDITTKPPGTIEWL